MPPISYLGAVLCVALMVLIAVVFDSPTSVLLLVGLALLALGVSYGMSRSRR